MSEIGKSIANFNYFIFYIFIKFNAQSFFTRGNNLMQIGIFYTRQLDFMKTPIY